MFLWLVSQIVIKQRPLRYPWWLPGGVSGNDRQSPSPKALLPVRTGQQLTADAVSLFDCLSVNWIKQKFPSCRISIAFQVWDPNLASEAAQWTKNCIYEFQYGSHGENMYYFETKLPDNVLIERAIDAWYSERYSWRMSGDCAEACSYTQVSRAFYLRSTPWNK